MRMHVASTLNELYYSISILYEILFYEMHFGFGLSSCANFIGNPVNECTRKRREYKKKCTKQALKEKVKCMESVFQQ